MGTWKEVENKIERICIDKVEPYSDVVSQVADVMEGAGIPQTKEMFDHIMNEVELYKGPPGTTATIKLELRTEVYVGQAL